MSIENNPSEEVSFSRHASYGYYRDDDGIEESVNKILPILFFASCCFSVLFSPYILGVILRDKLAKTHRKITKSPSLEESQKARIFRTLFPGLNSVERKMK